MAEYSPNNIRVANGKKALSYYHEVMKEKYPGSYRATYSEIEKAVLSRNPDFLAQLGDAVISSKFGQRRLKEAMENVAENTSVSPLHVPDVFAFTEGISKELSSFDYSLFGDAALDIAIDAGSGAKRIVGAVGEAAVSTVENTSFIVKNSKWIILAVLVFAGLIIWRISKNFKLSDLKVF